LAALVGTLVGMLAHALLSSASLPQHRPLSQRDRAFLFQMVNDPQMREHARRTLIDEARRLSLRAREALHFEASDRPGALEDLKDVIFDEPDEPAEITSRDRAAAAPELRAAP